MKRIAGLLLLAVLLVGCEKKNFETYIVEVVSADVNGTQYLQLDRHQGNPPQIILTEPFETSVTVYDDEPLHVTAAYENPAASTSSITVTVFAKDGTELQTTTAIGKAEVIIQR